MLAIPISWVTPPFSLFFFFYAQRSYWTSLHNILGFPSPFYSLGHHRPISFFPSFLHSHGLLLNSLGSLGPIAISFSFVFIGLQTNPIYQFFSLGSSGPFFCFLSISHDSHKLTTSFFGASMARLLSLEPLCYFVGLWIILPVIQAQ